MKTFEIATKKSKRKQLLKTMLLSIVGTVVLLVGTYMGLNAITSHNAWKIVRQYELVSEIAYPNIRNVNWSFDATSQFSGSFRAHQIKDIAGITVPFEEHTVHYSLRASIMDTSQADHLYLSHDKRSSYTHAHSYKIPLFFNTAYDYRKEEQWGPVLTQDIDLLPQMTGKVVEMAVTFDKPYTFKEIQSLIPKELNINWYWIGTTSQYNTAGLRLADQIGFTPNNQMAETYEQTKEAEKLPIPKDLSEEEAKKRTQEYQAKLEALSAEDIFANNYTFFQANLQKAVKEINHIYQDEHATFDLKKDMEHYLKNNPNGKTARFAGVIITGRAEDFASLEKADWIFGSNLGQSAEIEPYQTVKQERLTEK